MGSMEATDLLSGDAFQMQPLELWRMSAQVRSVGAEVQDPGQRRRPGVRHDRRDSGARRRHALRSMSAEAGAAREGLPWPKGDGDSLDRAARQAESVGRALQAKRGRLSPSAASSTG